MMQPARRWLKVGWLGGLFLSLAAAAAPCSRILTVSGAWCTGDIAVLGSIAYVGHESVLRVVGLTDAGKKRTFRWIPLAGGNIRNLAVSQDVLVVWDDRGGYFFDLTSPRNPRLVGKLPGVRVTDVALEGDLLFAAEGTYSNESALVIYDLKDPSRPAKVAMLQINHPIHEISIRDGLAALALGDDGAVIADISDLANPYILSTVPDISQDRCWHVALGNEVLYIGQHNGIGIYDLTAPGSPVAAGSLCCRGGKLQATDGWLYQDSTWGVRVFDTSNPLTPVEQARVPVGNFSVSGDLLVGGIGYDGLRFFDVFDPPSPHLMAEFPSTDHLAIAGMERKDEILYVVDWGSISGFGSIDVSSPKSPKIVGRAEESGGTRRAAFGLGLVAVVFEEGGRPQPPPRLSLFKMADPATYELSSSEFWDLPLGYFDAGITFVDELHFVAADLIFEVSDPSSPRMVADLEIPGTVHDHLVVGDRFLFSVSTDGLAVHDVSIPSRPIPVRWYPEFGGWRIDRRRGVMAISSGSEMIILDSSDPPSVGFVSAIEVGTACDISIVEDITLCVSGMFRVVDLSDPLAPRMLETIPVSSGASYKTAPGSVATRGGLAFLAALGDFLLSVDVSACTSRPLQAGIRASTTIPPVGQPVRFEDASTGLPTSWHWDFGDGVSSTERNPVHTYDRIGSFEVTLRVANRQGDASAGVTVTAVSRVRRPTDRRAAPRPTTIPHRP